MNCNLCTKLLHLQKECEIHCLAVHKNTDQNTKRTYISCIICLGNPKIRMNEWDKLQSQF